MNLDFLLPVLFVGVGFALFVGPLVDAAQARLARRGLPKLPVVPNPEEDRERSAQKLCALAREQYMRDDNLAALEVRCRDAWAYYYHLTPAEPTAPAPLVAETREWYRRHDGGIEVLNVLR